MVQQAQLGDAEVAYELGLAYDLAIGVPKDNQQAFAYFEQAARQNHPKAQYNLAICYALEKGVAKDIDQAKHWVNQARKNGYSGGTGF